MPIDRELLHKNPDAARAFLTSQSGAILHELGHYVAANLDCMIRGHLVIKAGGSSGAFALDAPSAELVSSDPARWSLVTSAGVLAEYHFCGETRIGAARSDIDAYGSRFGLSKVNSIIARWKRDHLACIAAHAACIEANFDRCITYCRSGRFLLGEHHVIPTCVFRRPRWRGPYARLQEFRLTYPDKRRRRALDEFLATSAASNLVVVRIA
jgi:hypothetical protein